MTDEIRGEQEPDNRQTAFLLIALCAVAASTMIVEIVIVKFIAFKVFHHFINVIVSTVVLSFAGAGTFLYMRGGEGDQTNWHAAAREAAIYSIALILSVVAFCWLPIDPYNYGLAVFWRIASLPIYFAMLAVPFFFAGLCISRVLADSSVRPSRVLLFDLTSAALAAAIAPTLLMILGGYGAIGAAAVLGMVAFFAFEKASGNVHRRCVISWSAAFLVLLGGILAYPGWAFKTYGLDIRTHKGINLSNLILHEFNGYKDTYWNAIARIDISHTGWSNNKDNFLFGLAPFKERLEGRVITVDAGANTRQFVAKGPLAKQKMFGEVLPAIPYIVRPDARDALIIGGGGGLDITVAKYFGIPRVDVVEMNPMTYKHVLLGQDDSDAALFLPWITSDARTNVTVFNKEARHFSSTGAPDTYDTIQATGVDTFTAIASGALAFSDNYLYTVDAVKSYKHLLKPNGVLSLTYCRVPTALPIRLFASYIQALEDSGVKEPWRNVAAVGTDMTAVLLSPTPFSQQELQRIRDWCKATGATFLFDPGRKTPDTPGLQPDEEWYTKIGFANHEQRQQILDTYPKNITPATDDKPYYYKVDRNEGWFFSDRYAYTPIAAIILIGIFAAVLITLPLTKIRVRQFSLSLFASAIFFAMCGFAFLLFEVSIVQLFSVFVGGPTYALAVVLVSVLIGYSIGCFIVGKLSLKPSTFLAIGIALFCANMAAFLFLPPAIKSLLVLSLPERIAFCAAITLAISALCGLPVPLAMESAKLSFKREIAWFWGISCAFNALGAACFPLISMQTGIRMTLAIVACLYLLAAILFASLCLTKSEKTAAE